MNLLFCPFCGSDKLAISTSSGNKCYYKQVYCKNCHAYGPRYRLAITQSYIKRYNFEHDKVSDNSAKQLWNMRIK